MELTEAGADSLGSAAAPIRTSGTVETSARRSFMGNEQSSVLPERRQGCLVLRPGSCKWCKRASAAMYQAKSEGKQKQAEGKEADARLRAAVRSNDRL
jgi:hypothetical protein